MQIADFPNSEHCPITDIPEGTDAGIWKWDLLSGDLILNTTWAEISGYTLDELAPLNAKIWHDMIHPLDLQPFNKLLHKLLTGESLNFSFEYRIRHKEGFWVWVHDHGSVMSRTNDGKPLLLTGTHEAILAKNEHNNNRKSSFFSAIFEFSPLAMIIISDNDKRILEANECWCTMFGFSRDQLPGTSLSELGIISEGDLENINTVLAGTGSVRNLKILLTSAQGKMNRVGVSVERITIQGETVTLWTMDELPRCQQSDYQSIQKYQALFDQSSDGIYLHDLEGKILDVNRAAVVQSGYCRDELMNLTIFDLHDDISTRNVIIRQWHQWEVGAVATLESKHRRKDGTVFNVEVVTGKIALEEDTIMQALVRDITERKRSETALQQSEENLRATLTSIGDGVIATDINGRIVQMNRVAEKLTGWSIDEARGRVLEDVFAIINAQTRRVVENPVTRVLQTGTIVGLANHTVLISRSGREYQIADSGAPIRGKDSKITGVVLVFRDVTEEYEMQERIVSSEERYRNLVMYSPDAIFINMDDRVTLVNQACMKLFNAKSEEELIGKSPYDLFHPDYHEQIRERIHRLRNFGEAVPMIDEQIVRLDGIRVNVSVTAAPFPAGGKNAIHVILRDITETKRLSERIRQTEKMEALGALAGGIAHDFNNILGGIIGYADLSLMDVESGSQLEENLKRILRAGDRARNLVNQILAFSRQSTQVMSPQYLRVIIKEVVDLLRASLPSSIEIRSDLAKDTLPVLADPTKIHEIVMNLCTNAAHAMGEKGYLEISYEEEHLDRELEGRVGRSEPGLYSVITVRDNGCGMNKEVLCRIFDPFFTTKEAGEGTGMGLAVVFGIVETHGGNITVESTPAKGTEFKIYLPKTVEEQLPAQDQQLPIQGGNERILLIDDEVVMGEICNEMLRELGYTVTLFNDSTVALETFRNTPDAFDIVITDQTMPVISGIELSREVLRIREDIPIILCTGYSNFVNEQIAIEAGISAYIEKPFRRKEIAGKIRAVLDKS